MSNPYENALGKELREAVLTMRREEIAVFCLGPKGLHYAGEEWERRAALLDRDPIGYLAGRYEDDDASPGT